MRYQHPLLAAALIGSCTLLAGCNNGGSSGHSAQEDAMAYSTQKPVEEALPLKLMSEGQNSTLNNNGPEVVVFSDQQKFSVFWTEHMTGKPAPSVDFKRFMVLAVVDENQATGGYHLKVNSVMKGADEVMVEAVRVHPGKNCMNTMIVTKPYAIVMVPRVDKPVSLSLSMATEDCK